MEQEIYVNKEILKQDVILNALHSVGFVPRTIDVNKNYWFVRTESGRYYDEFILGEFIAIGWDQITPFDLNTPEEDILQKIQTAYPDANVPKLIYNQINRFCNEMKPGDVVIIPSSSSNYLAFGEIISDVQIVEISEDDIIDGACPYTKRRAVRWHKSISKYRIDPYLYQLFRSHHTISSANNYASHIDRTLNDFYIKGDKVHLILHVETENNIPAILLVKLISGLLDRIDDFSKSYENVNSSEIEIKINVQSPGLVEFISGVAGVGILGLIIVGLFGGKAKFSKTPTEGVNAEVSTEGLPGLLEKLIQCYERYQTQTRLNNQEMRQIMEQLQIKNPSDNSH